MDVDTVKYKHNISHLSDGYRTLHGRENQDEKFSDSNVLHFISACHAHFVRFCELVAFEYDQSPGSSV